MKWTLVFLASFSFSWITAPIEAQETFEASTSASLVFGLGLGQRAKFHIIPDPTGSIPTKSGNEPGFVCTMEGRVVVEPVLGRIFPVDPILFEMDLSNDPERGDLIVPILGFIEGELIRLDEPEFFLLTIELRPVNEDCRRLPSDGSTRLDVSAYKPGNSTDIVWADGMFVRYPAGTQYVANQSGGI